MENVKLRDYITPEIEMLTVIVEQGFALSSMESIGNENPTQEW